MVVAQPGRPMQLIGKHSNKTMLIAHHPSILGQPQAQAHVRQHGASPRTPMERHFQSQGSAAVQSQQRCIPGFPVEIDLRPAEAQHNPQPFPGFVRRHRLFQMSASHACPLMPRQVHAVTEPMGVASGIGQGCFRLSAADSASQASHLPLVHLNACVRAHRLSSTTRGSQPSGCTLEVTFCSQQWLATQTAWWPMRSTFAGLACPWGWFDFVGSPTTAVTFGSRCVTDIFCLGRWCWRRSSRAATQLQKISSCGRWPFACSRSSPWTGRSWEPSAGMMFRRPVGSSSRAPSSNTFRCRRLHRFSTGVGRGRVARASFLFR